MQTQIADIIVPAQFTGADVVLRGEPDQTLGQLGALPWEAIVDAYG